MSALLYGWELGSGLSHLQLAQGLLAALPPNQDAALALQQLAGAHRRWPSQRLYQAPLAAPARQLANPASYAEILFEVGFHDADVLAGQVRAWQSILDVERPCVVVADHAPTLLLASLGRPLRRATVGAGFFCPPQASPLPVFRSWERVPADRPAQVEARVLANINRVLAGQGLPALACVADLFDCDANFLTTVPALDHYPRPTLPGHTRYSGFYAVDTGGAQPCWPAGEDAPGPRVFAYLSAGYPGLDGLIAVLGKLGWPTIVHCTASPATAGAWPHLLVTREHLDMRQVMARADIVVCHAGAGTLGWALEHGKAVVALPLQAEQTVAVLRLKESGLGQTLLDADPGRFRRALREAADSPSRRQAVQAFAAELRPSASNMAAIADVLAGWCAAPPGAAAEASGAGRPPSG